MADNDFKDIQQYKPVHELSYKGCYLALLHNSKADTNPYMSAESFLNVRFWKFEPYQTEAEAKEKFIERFYDMIHPVIQEERKWAEHSEDIKLLTAADCLPDSICEDYQNQILLVRPEHLSAKFRYPDYQIFVADNGNGCHPNGHGTTVYGTYLFDGDRGTLQRHSFYGIADSAKLPDWVSEKLISRQDICQGEDFEP